MSISPLLLRKGILAVGAKKTPATATETATTTDSPPAKTGMEVMAEKMKSLQAPVPSNQSESAEPRGPEDFKSVLSQLDQLVSSELGITPLTIDLVRRYVMTIMIDLKHQPELNNIMIDKDARNILKYIRFVKQDAIEAQETSSTKRHVAAVHKAGKLNKPSLKNFKMPTLKLPSSLEELGDVNTDK